MCTSDEADLVATLSYVVAEEDLVKPNTILALSTEALELQMRGAPVTGIRPMTEDEIREYREADHGDGQNQD
jgi:hypothetical protein